MKRQYILGEYNITVNLSDLSSFNEQLADRLLKTPTVLVVQVMIRPSLGTGSRVHWLGLGLTNPCRFN